MKVLEGKKRKPLLWNTLNQPRYYIQSFFKNQPKRKKLNFEAQEWRKQTRSHLKNKELIELEKRILVIDQTHTEIIGEQNSNCDLKKE